jgi:lysozyme
MARVNAVVDISHHNGSVDLAQAKSSGIVGVLQKVTQGTAYSDPTYEPNRQKASDAGLLWGGYHFGTGGDGVAQAEHFLKAAALGNGDLAVLDFEANLQGPSMTLEEARAFVTHVFESRRRWPGLYSGHYIKELLHGAKDPVVGKCWFWLAQYGPTPVVPPAWKRWSLWQYTDGALGPPPYEVPGIGRCDRDLFNGTLAGLREFWKS